MLFGISIFFFSQEVTESINLMLFIGIEVFLLKKNGKNNPFCRIIMLFDETKTLILVLRLFTINNAGII